MAVPVSIKFGIQIDYDLDLNKVYQLFLYSAGQSNAVPQRFSKKHTTKPFRLIRCHREVSVQGKPPVSLKLSYLKL